MLNQFLLIITVLSFPAVVYLTRNSGHDARKSLESFTLGTREYGAFAIAAGLSMSFVGGAATLNMASLGYSYGWSVAVDPLAVSVALLVTAALVGRIRSGSGITLSEILTGSSARLRFVLGFTSFGVYLLLTGAQFVAVGRLLTPYFPGAPPVLLMVLPAMVVFGYIFLRGFDSVTSTDVFQLLILLAFFVFPITLTSFLSSAADSVSRIVPHEPAPLNLLIYLALPLFFVPVSHDAHIRVLAASSKRRARLGLIGGASLYSLLVCASIEIGVFLRRSGYELSDPESALPFFFQKHMASFGILAAVAVLAAIISTLDSFAFDSIVSVGNDLFKPFIGRLGLTEQAIIILSVSAVLSLGLLIATVFDQILGLILAGMLLYVSIFIPVSIGRWASISDDILVGTSCATLLVLVTIKSLAYTPPLEPLFYIALHFFFLAPFWVLDR